MEELKPCPFCGGKGKIIHTKSGFDGRGMSAVICEICGAKSENYPISFNYSSDEKAIGAWNRRISDGGGGSDRDRHAGNDRDLGDHSDQERQETERKTK